MLRNNPLSHNSGGEENFVASCVFCKNHFEKGLIQGQRKNRYDKALIISEYSVHSTGVYKNQGVEQLLDVWESNMKMTECQALSKPSIHLIVSEAEPVEISEILERKGSKKGQTQKR